MDKYDVLKTYYGYSSFRGGQERLIDAILGGRDAFGIMPTGGGKSLCYQVPAIMMEGVTFVISPLISLMKDQVAALRNNGVSACFVNSSLSSEQLKAAYRSLGAGEYKIVYIAPERLASDGFVSLAKGLNISFIAVDEAHCISQWGQDFRPSYLKIVEFLEKLPKRPVLAAFTATATLQVRDDVERILKLRAPVCLTTGFDRPNLSFEVQKPSDKMDALRCLLEQYRGRVGIIYCATRSSVESVCDSLRAAGIEATRYHAGLPDEERHKNQEDFLHDHRTMMVATNAFGMGIDKPNVSLIIHYNMPKSLEAYYQEAGRAGRDGGEADCIMLFSVGDISIAKFFIRSSSENSELSDEELQLVVQNDQQRLEAMVGYCKTKACLRGYILDYFGQAHGKHCGNCGNCLQDYQMCDITIEAQKILSCIKRAKDKLGHTVGVALIVRALRGDSDKRLKELGLDTLTTFGIMRTTKRSQIREYIGHMESAGYLFTDPAHKGLDLTAASRNVLFHNEHVKIPVKISALSAIKRAKKSDA